MRSIRQELGLSTVAFGRALGYRGNTNTVQLQIRRFERDRDTIPPWAARVARGLTNPARKSGRFRTAGFNSRH